MTGRSPGRGRCARWGVAAAAAVGVLAAPAGLDGQVRRPRGAQRIVHRFDFEERDVNFEAVPMHWVRVFDEPGPGRISHLPAWNRAGFDNTERVSGSWSVRLPTRGGGTMLRLEPGVAPAIPGADYLISAKVRTEALLHARARFTARLLDARRDPIAGSEVRSRGIITAGRWVNAAVQVTGEHPEAAWIQIDLEVLQPDRMASRSPHQVILEDVRGAAWFDDIVIQQLPRVELRAESPGNFVVAPERPTLVTVVHDLTGESLRAKARVFDLDGRTVDETEFDVSWGGRPSKWTPRLPQFGWFGATLDVLSETGVVSRAQLEFVYAPEPSRDAGSEASRFRIVGVDAVGAAARDVLELVRRSGAGGVAVEAPTERGADAGAVELVAGVVEALLDRGSHVEFALTGRPAWEILQDTRTSWLEELKPLVDRFGQRVRRWRVGEPDDGVDLPWREGVVADAARLERKLADVMPEPRVVLPWTSQAAMPSSAEALPALVVAPPETQPAGIAELAGTWPSGADVTLLVRAQAAERFGRRAAAIDLTRRLVEAWRAQPAAVAIERAWTLSARRRDARAEHDGEERERGAMAMPTPELAVLRQMVERLSGRRVVAKLPAADGVVGYVLEGPGPDAIVAWNEFAAPEDAVIRAYLTEGPVQVLDPFGNARMVEMSGGMHEVRLSETPVFIEGVDVNLARFRATARVEPAFIPSTAERHSLEVVLENPWPIAISGRMRVAEPSHWKISPRVQAFSIAPGATERLGFEASFGVAEEAGEARLELEVELSADRAHPPIRLSPKLEIGLPYVQLSASYRFEKDETGELNDLAVTLVITNVGERALTMQAFAQAPGFAREQAPVSDLQPTHATVKRFLFKGGAKLKGDAVRVGLIETDGLGRLNRTLRVE